MEKFKIINKCTGIVFKIGERTLLKGDYLSKVTDILLDVGSTTTYLTMTFSNKEKHWISTVVLENWSLKELVELTSELVKLSSCERLIIDSNGMGRGVIDGLTPILEQINKSYLLVTSTQKRQTDEVLPHSIYSYLNKAIIENEKSLKEYIVDKDFDNKIYKECVAVSIILHEAKLKLLKRDYGFVGESYE